MLAAVITSDWFGHTYMERTEWSIKAA